MKKLVFQLALGLLSILAMPLNAQKYDPGSGKTVLLIGQTFQQEYINYVNGVGFAPSGSSHYGSIYLGTIEQGDDNPNAKFLDYVRSVQDDNYALVAISIKDNTAAGGYGQMINPAWGQFNSNAVWEACDDIRNGKWDSEIDQMAQTFADRPDVKFYVRVGYEVSLFMFGYKGEQNANTWLEEQANAGINVFEDPDKVDQMDRHAYIEAYNHIASRIKRKASNVSFVYHPVRGFNDTKWLYPGDENVDFVAFSIFNNDVCIECNGTFNCEGEDVDPNLQQSMDFAKEHGKPLMIAESACQAPATGSPSAFNDYLNRLDKVVKNNDVRVLAYINSDWPAHDWDANWGDSRVEVNSTVLNKWKSTFGQGTRYLHSGSSVPTPTCNDGIQNGNETGVDCGGSCPACNGTTPTCNDGIQNGNETGVDCGGSCPSCSTTPTCNDGIQNGDETGVDCGGSCSACQAANDCPASHPYACGGGCYTDKAQAESAGCTGGGGNEPTCNDGIQNGNETGVDCGGSCPACQQEPTCNDGIQNGNETGVDCGGSCPACAEPTCNDGIMNGNETGVDCGGSCPNTCPEDNLSAKLLPPGGKILLSIGQDLKTQDDYMKGGVDAHGFPIPGGIVTYASFHTLEEETFPQYGALGESPSGAPYNNDVNWGAGPLNGRNAADGFPQSALVIALNMADGADPGDVWCSGCLAQIGNGGYDTEIKALAAFCNRRPNEAIYLRIGFEFDGKWNLGYSNTTAFKNAWRRIVDVMRGEGVNNVAYVWQSCASPIDEILDEANENVEDWWPGDNYVDWLGLSWFLLPNEKPTAAGYNPKTQKQLADEIVNLARRKNKPVLVAESTPQGYDLVEMKNCNISTLWDGAAGQGCVSKSASQIWNEWFTPYFDYIYSNKDVIRHVTYINVNWDDDTYNFGSESDYREGYWGRAGVHVNDQIAGNWKSELSKSVWMHGSSNTNANLLSSKKSGDNTSDVTYTTVQESRISVYPNPVNDVISIKGLEKNEEYTIYNFAGKAVLKDKKAELNLTNLGAGMYFLKTKSNETVKFIKK